MNELANQLGYDYLIGYKTIGLYHALQFYETRYGAVWFANLYTAC